MLTLDGHTEGFGGEALLSFERSRKFAVLVLRFSPGRGRMIVSSGSIVHYRGHPFIKSLETETRLHGPTLNFAKIHPRILIPFDIIIIHCNIFKAFSRM